MWVFGYGSLMWGDWQTKFGCTRRVIAELQGYTRALNKASVRNWGTRANPGPTLNLAPSPDGRCRGIAFEFPDNRQQHIIDYLKDREGGFELRTVSVQLEDGVSVQATTPIYARGENLIRDKTTEQIIAMILAASGTSGTCVDYVRNIATQLKLLGVGDPAISSLAAKL